MVPHRVKHTSLAVRQSTLDAHRVPAEIWQECWRYLSDRQLKEICSVSKTFRDTAQWLLLRELAAHTPYWGEITRKNWRSETRKLMRSHERLRGLAADPHLARMVKKWDFAASRNLHHVLTEEVNLRVKFLHLLTDAYDTLINDFLDTLPCFSNVTEVVLKTMGICDRLAESLASLPSLSRVSLEGCSIVTQKDHCIKVEHLMVQEPPRFRHTQASGTTSTLRLFSAERLETLRVRGSRSPESYFPSLLASGPFPILREFEFVVQWPRGESERARGLLFDLLGICPHLRVLTLRCSVRWLEEGELPTSAFPLLESFTGPLLSAGVFFRGRHLKFANFNKSDFVKEEELAGALHQLSSSRDTLETLAMPCLQPPTNAFQLIYELFPNLRRLRMGLLDPGERIPESDTDSPEELLPDEADYHEEEAVEDDASDNGGLSDEESEASEATSAFSFSMSDFERDEPEDSAPVVGETSGAETQTVAQTSTLTPNDQADVPVTPAPPRKSARALFEEVKDKPLTSYFVSRSCNAWFICILINDSVENL